jgi:hypothetical protein
VIEISKANLTGIHRTCASDQNVASREHGYGSGTQNTAMSCTSLQPVEQSSARVRGDHHGEHMALVLTDAMAITMEQLPTLHTDRYSKDDKLHRTIIAKLLMELDRFEATRLTMRRNIGNYSFEA